MSDRPSEKSSKDESPLARKVETKAERKLRAQRHIDRTVWLGLGMIGLIGWSVAVPTLIGTALGLWLDERYPSSFSWTLTMLIIGLFIGCLNAWHWVAKEHKEMQEEQEDYNE